MYIYIYMYIYIHINKYMASLHGITSNSITTRRISQVCASWHTQALLLANFTRLKCVKTCGLKMED